MKTLFAGTKFITSGITKPSELNRGEIAIFSATGTLIAADATGLSDDAVITFYCGLGNGEFKTGATIKRDKLVRSSMSPSSSTPSTFLAESIVPLSGTSPKLTVHLSNFYVQDTYPITYSVSVPYDGNLESWIAKFKLEVETVITSKLKEANSNSIVTISSNTDPDDATVTTSITVSISCPFEIGVSLTDMSSNGVFKPYVPAVGQGSDVVFLEKEYSVFRGNNPQRLPQQGAVNPKYYTADESKTYQIYNLNFVSTNDGDMAREDSQMYIVEQLIAIDSSVTANVTAATTLIESL